AEGGKAQSLRKNGGEQKQLAVEMTGGGKRGKPKSRFPTLPTALGNPQEQRIPTFHTATTAGDRLKAPPNPQHPKVGQIKPPKWAKRSCQTQQSGQNGEIHAKARVSGFREVRQRFAPWGSQAKNVTLSNL